MLAAAYLVGAGRVVNGATVAEVAAEFPSLMLHAVAAPPARVPFVDTAAVVAAGPRGWQLDRMLDDAPAVALPATRAAQAVAVLTRLQRLVDRRNRESATLAFDAVLARHRALHELSRPLVRADYAHARDVWQWLLRLDPNASAAVQVAALFHDIERLVSEGDARVEQHADDYQGFKDAHARGSAVLLRATIGDLLPEALVARAAALVFDHERPDARDPERTLLGDADALSFFSLNSGGYVDYFGAAQAARKIAWTLDRLSARARRRLDAVELRADVRALIAHAIFGKEERA
jgi:hypothetical protein